MTLLGNDCSNVHPDACNAYKPCERLVTPTTQNPLIDSSSKTPTKNDRDAAKATVDAACMIPENPSQIDYNWISKCHGVCASRLCCFVDKNIGSNCQATQECEYMPHVKSCSMIVETSSALRKLRTNTPTLKIFVMAMLHRIRLGMKRVTNDAAGDHVVSKTNLSTHVILW